MKTSKHMPKMYIKYWLTYCISIDVQMIHTHSHSYTTRSAAWSHIQTLRSESESASPPQLKGV